MLHPTACFDPLNHVLGQVQITLRRTVYFRGSFVVVWSKDAVWKFILTAFGQHHCSLPGFCTLGHLSTLVFEVHKHIPATYRWIRIRHLFCGTSCQIWEIETLPKKIRLNFFLFLKIKHIVSVGSVNPNPGSAEGFFLSTVAQCLLILEDLYLTI